MVNICIFSQVANREMKKKKQKQHFKEVEKRSSEEQVDLMESYTDKPVEEKVSKHFFTYDVIKLCWI